MILDLEGSRYLTVRGSGVYLFELLQDERHPDELVRAVLAKFEVDEQTARRDVNRFLFELSHAGLLAT